MNVPEAPVSGENFKSAVIRWITETVRYLKESRVQPDNRTIFTRQIPGGQIFSTAPATSMVHAARGSGGSTSNMFKVTLEKRSGDTTPQLYIRGFEETYAGWIYYNQKAVHCPNGKVAPSAGYLCIRAVGDYTAGVSYCIVSEVPSMPIITSSGNELIDGDSLAGELISGGTGENAVPKYPIAYIEQDEETEEYKVISLFQDHIPYLACWRECSDGIDEAESNAAEASE